MHKEPFGYRNNLQKVIDIIVNTINFMLLNLNQLITISKLIIFIIFKTINYLKNINFNKSFNLYLEC